MISTRVILGILVVVFLLIALPAFSNDKSDINWEKECHKLASDPWEPGNAGHGVLLNEIKSKPALEACEKALIEQLGENKSIHKLDDP